MHTYCPNSRTNQSQTHQATKEQYSNQQEYADSKKSNHLRGPYQSNPLNYSGNVIKQLSPYESLRQPCQPDPSIHQQSQRLYSHYSSGKQFNDLSSKWCQLNPKLAEMCRPLPYRSYAYVIPPQPSNKSDSDDNIEVTPSQEPKGTKQDEYSLKVKQDDQKGLSRSVTSSQQNSQHNSQHNSNINQLECTRMKSNESLPLTHYIIRSPETEFQILSFMTQTQDHLNKLYRHPQHFHLNRHASIMAYDDTRVKFHNLMTSKAPQSHNRFGTVSNGYENLTILKNCPQMTNQTPLESKVAVQSSKGSQSEQELANNHQNCKILSSSVAGGSFSQTTSEHSTVASEGDQRMINTFKDPKRINSPKKGADSHKQSSFWNKEPQNQTVWNDKVSFANNSQPQEVEKFRAQPAEDLKALSHPAWFSLYPDDTNHPDNYVNANYIRMKVGGKEHTLVATQAPMYSTFINFWRMIEMLGTKAIFMLCNLVEKKNISCDPYWFDHKNPSGVLTVKRVIQTTDRLGPLCPVPAANSIQSNLAIQSENKLIEVPVYEIRIISETVVQEKVLTIRKLELRNLMTHSTHVVTQYHLMDWKDGDKPTDKTFASLMSLLDVLVIEVSQWRYPIVHCSAGVGRTGTFIALAWLRLLIDYQQSFSIFECVRVLREQRWGMVFKQCQYQFLYWFVKKLLSELCESETDGKGNHETAKEIQQLRMEGLKGILNLSPIKLSKSLSEKSPPKLLNVFTGQLQFGSEVEMSPKRRGERLLKETPRVRGSSFGGQSLL